MRYILGFLGFLALIILVIILIARGSGRDSSLNVAPAPELAEAASTDARFTLTENGPIVAEEEHYRIRITVSRVGRRVEVIRGYGSNVVAQANFDNSEDSFRAFLSALDRNGYTIESRTRFESEAGLCSSGRRFVAESNQFDSEFRRWWTSCSNFKGSFGGASSAVQRLFTDQIPEYRQFISDTRRATGLRI